MSTISAVWSSLQRRLVWVVLLLVTVGLGRWGFHEAWPGESPLYSLYRTARLFTLNLDVKDDTEPRPVLWVAAWLAPILLVRGIAELFRDQLHSVARFFVHRRMIVFGAGDDVNAIVRAERLTPWRRWRRAVVVADPDKTALTVARDLGASVELASGLSAGDRVIENPPDGVADGDPVRVAMAGPKGG